MQVADEDVIYFATLYIKAQHLLLRAFAAINQVPVVVNI